VKILLMSPLLVAGFWSQEGPPDRFVHGSWPRWSTLGLGSWVTHELEEGGQKSRMTTTLKKKEPGQVTLEEVVEAGGVKQAARERVLTRAAGAAGDYETLGTGGCPACKKASKAHKPMEQTRSTEKVKVSDRDVVCDTSEWIAFDCDDREISREKTGYSDQVPGLVVLVEKKTKEFQTRLVCVGFEKK
jgi:hypothetical protein